MTDANPTLTTEVPPILKRNLFSSTVLPKPCCNVWRAHGLHRRKETKRKIKGLFDDVATKLNVFSTLYMGIFLNTLLHKVRATIILFVFALTFYFLYDGSTHDLDISIISIFFVLSFAAYTSLQTVYYCYQKGLLPASCYEEVGDGVNSLTLVYTGESIVMYIFWIANIKNLLSLDSSLATTIGKMNIISCILLSLLDTALLHLLHGAGIIASFILAVLTLCVYEILYTGYYMFYLKCEMYSEERATSELKQQLVPILRDLAISYGPDVFSTTCPICLDKFAKDKDVVVILDCDSKHVLHKVCAGEWLLHSNTCPMCRKLIFPSSLYNAMKR